MLGWVIGGTSLLSAFTSYQSGQDMAESYDQASQLAAQSEAEQLAFQKEIYEDYEPYIMQGLEGYSQLLEDPSAYEKTPGYQFRLEAGLKSMGIADGQVNQRNLTGSQLKSIARYSQDYASSDYDRAIQRYAGLAGISGGVAAVGAEYAQGVSNTMAQGTQAQNYYNTQGASSRAAGNLGMTNALTGGLYNYSMFQQMTDSPSFYGTTMNPGEGT